ncbi:MAG: RDD family protein [Pseudomonadota bacterium]
MTKSIQVFYAGFWIRLIAYFIDAFVLLFVMVMIFKMQGEVAPEIFPHQIPSQALAMLISWLYFSLQYASPYQATLGMRMVGIKVVDLEYKRLSLARATGRHFAHYISAFILFAGFFLIAFTKRKQGLHDYLASTYVIYEGE